MPNSITKYPPNNTESSPQIAINYRKKKRERTDSSMSQLHIGIYKVMVYDLLLFKIVNQVSNIAFNIGEPLECWTFDLDVLLKKNNKI